ncbi:MAG: sortase [bacterium]
MRRLVRALSTLLLAGGVGLLGWALLVWQWQDPFTYLLMQREQRALAQRYEERLAAYRPSTQGVAASVATVAAEARRYRLASGRGEAIARLRVPKLDLNLVVVNGTDKQTLKTGPGRHLSTFMPGEGELSYVAGHRTTYGAPFSHIDKLKRGDRVTVQLPYARFEYAVTGRRIVPATYVQALESRGREELALQACWPRFFASQRIIVYAKPVKVTPRGAKRGTRVAADADG